MSSPAMAFGSPIVNSPSSNYSSINFSSQSATCVKNVGSSAAGTGKPKARWVNRCVKETCSSSSPSSHGSPMSGVSASANMISSSSSSEGSSPSISSPSTANTQDSSSPGVNYDFMTSSSPDNARGAFEPIVDSIYLINDRYVIYDCYIDI